MVYYASYGYNDKVNGVHGTYEKAIKSHVSRNKLIMYCALPEDWSMYTSKGNKRIEAIASKFVQDVLNKVRPETALEKFLKTFVKLYNTKTMGEAADTAVRESVYGFVKQFSTLFDFGEQSIDKIWEKYC